MVARHRRNGCRVTLAVACLLVAALTPVAAAAQQEPPAVAVMPFHARRAGDGHAWLGRYVQDVLRDALLSGRHAAVMPAGAAARWADRLKLDGLTAPDEAALADMPVDVVVQGSTQRVLDLLEVRWRVSRKGEAPGAVQNRRIDLAGTSPHQAAQELARAVLSSLPIEPEALRVPRQPDDWDTVEAVYAWRAQQAPGDPAARAKRLNALDDLPRPDPVAARLDGWRADLLLQQAVLDLKRGDQRRERLQAALDAAEAAVRAEPWQSRWYVLKGEALFFLEREYEARSEASVARLKNPLEAAAYVVQAMAEGLSTGRATQLMKKALAIDPSLDSAESGSPAALAQGGVLRAQVSRWRELDSERPRGVGNADYEALVRRGKQAFLEQRWQAAVDAFQQAMQQGETDYRPRLYLNRIRMELGQPEQAVQDLRELAAEFPLVTDVRFHLAVALEASGAHQAAREALQRLREDAPDDPRVLYHLGRVAVAAGNPADAVPPLRELLLRDPGHADGWLQLGIAQAKLEQWNEARQSLQHVLKLNPDSQPARRWMARVNEQSGG